jgi:hypothetical protein
MDAEELDKVAKTLDKLSQSSRRGPEPNVPDIPAHAPPAPRLRLPVRALARPRCADGCTATLALLLLQLLEADLLPTTFVTLPAPQQLQLPRVPASKLSLPQARESRVTNEYHAVMGSTHAAAPVPAGITACAAAAAVAGAAVAAVVGREAAEAGQSG